MIGGVLCLDAVQLPTAEQWESHFNGLSSHIYEVELPCLQHCLSDVCPPLLRDLPGCDRGSGIDLHRYHKKNVFRKCFFYHLHLLLATQAVTILMLTFMHTSVDCDIAIYVGLTLFRIIQLHYVLNAAVS